MPDNILFSLAFLSQIILISVWLPARVKANARHLLDTYPAAQYPRLYPRPPADYERALVHFSYTNWAIVVVGVCFWIVFNLDATNDDYAGVAWAIFMLQSAPFFLLEVFTFKTWRLMRAADHRSIKTASLRPRRLLDVVSVPQLTLLATSYLVFALFAGYISLLELPWFSAAANLAILGAGYVMLCGIVYWQWTRGDKDPYLEEDDHIRRIRYMVRQFVFVCVALTVYATVTISLQAFEMREFKQLAMSIYAQLLALGAYYSSYQRTDINYEVYREATVTGEARR